MSDTTNTQWHDGVDRALDLIESGTYYEKLVDENGVNWGSQEHASVTIESIEKAKQALTQLHEAAVREARIAQMGAVRTKANELACKDSTMIGSENLRGYHYANALDLLTHELDKTHDIRWLEVADRP